MIRAHSVILRWAGVLVMATLAGAGRSPAAPEQGDRVAAAPIVETFLHRLAPAAGMRAHFTQVNLWAAIGEADTARGQLTLAPPHRFRLEYEHPRGHRVGCCGTHVWTYIPEERQVLRAALAATTGWGDFFLRALVEGADSLATLATVAGVRRAARIELGPRPEWGVQEMQVVLDADRGEPLAYLYVDEEGNRYRFEFRRVEFPAMLPDTLFAFGVPPGYELVDVD
jgi:outer membrane lipoprotein-sorting protein